MKKLIATIIGFSLFLGSAVFAQNNFSGFYPVENDDTPSYLQVDIKDYKNVSKLTSHTNAFDAFYPIEDDDTPEY